MSASPVFFPTNIYEYDHLLSCSDSRHFVAKDRDKIIGFLAIGYEGENFIGNNKNMLHICGAYFMNDYRGTGIPAGLIDYLIKKIKSEGIEYLGVDFETINPNALRFWGKYFSSYTYSFVRRIDERIIGYEKYLKDL
jgi:ribosomal protein S18 acetylase RimI-like enzyme